MKKVLKVIRKWERTIRKAEKKSGKECISTIIMKMMLKEIKEATKR